MPCPHRHSRKQSAVIEAACGCVVVLFDCNCQYLERSCVYAQVLLGVLPKPEDWFLGEEDDDEGDKSELDFHIERLLKRRAVLIDGVSRETKPPG